MLIGCADVGFNHAKFVFYNGADQVKTLSLILRLVSETVKPTNACRQSCDPIGEIIHCLRAWLTVNYINNKSNVHTLVCWLFFFVVFLPIVNVSFSSHSHTLWLLLIFAATNKNCVITIF